MGQGEASGRRSGEVMEMALAERSELADLLDTLTPDEWRAETLCPGWSVRDVVAHAISYDEIGWPRTLARIVRAKLTRSSANAIGLAEESRSPSELLAHLRAGRRPTGLPALGGGMVALVDGMIHQQDIRRPLGRTRAIPPRRLRAALDLVLRARPVGALPRSKGLAVTATDVAWSHGDGPEVSGPGEAVLMALAGRREAAMELAGPGRSILLARV